MSEVRIKTCREDEPFIEAMQDALGAPHKWYAIQLALGASLGRPPHAGLSAADLTTPNRDGGEYRLQQITGEGKKPPDRRDDTDLLRALFWHLHGEDAFHAETGNEKIRRLIEFHIHQGVELLRRRWKPGDDIYSLLQTLLAESIQSPEKFAPPVPAERLLSVLAELGVRAELPGPPIVGPRITRYRLLLGSSEYLARLQSSFDRLELDLGIPIGLTMHRTSEARVIELDVPRPRETWKHFGGADFAQWLLSAPTAPELPVCPGVDVLGNPYWKIDVARAPHIFLAGTTGSGKSVCLHALICSLIARRTASELKLVLIDPKRVELAAYEGLPHLGDQGIITRAADALAALRQLTQEMEQRYAALSKVSLTSVAEARRQKTLDMPWIVVVVEELADLVLGSPETQGAIVQLAQKSRAAGIHLILATQRPDAATFSGLLRQNVDTRIALSVRTVAESRIILDAPGAESLLKPGDMLVQRSGERNLDRVHGVFLLPGDIARFTRNAKERSA